MYVFDSEEQWPWNESLNYDFPVRILLSMIG